jgi:hypothetical protein
LTKPAALIILFSVGIGVRLGVSKNDVGRGGLLLLRATLLALEGNSDALGRNDDDEGVVLMGVVKSMGRAPPAAATALSIGV